VQLSQHVSEREPAPPKNEVPPAVLVRGLTKTYRGKVTALAGLDLEVPAGMIFGLVGPNGSGKTTTIKILTTLSRPDSGTATVAGIDVLAEPDRVRRAIGMVAQKTAVDNALTARENLEFAGRVHGMRGAALRRRVDEVLERFGLTERAGRPPITFSGGTRRRLDLAVGLVHRPAVLFLDEPTVGLDPEARTGLWDEIARLASEDRMTVLLTTHYLEEADRLADRLAVMDQGVVVALGSPAELKADLRGEAARFTLAHAADAETARAVLEARPDVHGTQLDETVVHARVDDGARSLPALIQAVEAAGVPVEAVTVARPSLDDVYLQHTGRDFQKAHQAGQAGPPPSGPPGVTIEEDDVKEPQS
jgi:ABC-2 type transport system ATP-binding protein